MGVATDIVESWWRPRRVMRRQLAAGQREDRVVVFLLLGCILVVCSRIPALVRAQELGAAPANGASLGSVIMAWLFVAPLLFYGLALVAHLIARMLGGQGSAFDARLALFWTMLAVGPLWLIYGLIEGYLGTSAAITQAAGLLALVSFFSIWLARMVEAARNPEGARP